MNEESASWQPSDLFIRPVFYKD